MTDPSPVGLLLKELFPVVEHAVGKAHRNKHSGDVGLSIPQSAALEVL